MQQCRPLQRKSRTLAFFFCLTWLLILLAGADHPPPPGFINLLPLLALAGVVVYWRVPQYAHWRMTSRSWRKSRVLVEGALAGLGIAALTYLWPPGSTPSPPIAGSDVMIWWGVLGLLGIANAALVYLATTVFVAVERSTSRSR